MELQPKTLKASTEIYNWLRHEGFNIEEATDVIEELASMLRIATMKTKKGKKENDRQHNRASNV